MKLNAIEKNITGEVLGGSGGWTNFCALIEPHCCKVRNQNILKQLSIHVGAFNLSLIFRNLLALARAQQAFGNLEDSLQ